MGGGWLMNVIERCIVGPWVAAGFRMAAASADGLHGVLRWRRMRYLEDINEQKMWWRGGGEPFDL